jgi:hypothetical protein
LTALTRQIEALSAEVNELTKEVQAFTAGK